MMIAIIIWLYVFGVLGIAGLMLNVHGDRSIKNITVVSILWFISIPIAGAMTVWRNVK